MNAIVIDESRLNGKTAWDVCLLLKEYGLLCKPTHENTIRLVNAPLTLNRYVIIDTTIVHQCGSNR